MRFLRTSRTKQIKAAHAAGAKPLMVPDMIEPNEEISKLCHKIFVNLHEVRAFFESNLD